MSNKTKKLLSNLTRSSESDNNQDVSDATPEKIDNLVVALDHKKSPRKEPILKKDYKVHSFVIDLKDFDYLERFVEHMKYSGNIYFTQKEALSLAISFLKKKYPENELINKPRG